MSLSDWQQVRLGLSGTIAFPKPFPTLGKISFLTSRETRPATGLASDVEYVLVKSQLDDDITVTHQINVVDVRAVFIATEQDGKTPLKSSAKDYVAVDLTHGIWFLGADVRPQVIRPIVPIDDAEGVLGIVFAHRHAGVLTTVESIHSADEEIPGLEFYAPCSCGKKYKPECSCC